MKRTIWLGSALVVTMLLGGCTNQFYDERMQAYQPELPHQVYPIEVVKGQVRLRIPVRKGNLSPRDRAAVRRLAQDASSKLSTIIITRPAGSVRAEVHAAEITRLLADEGVVPSRIVHRTGNTDSIVISYRRKFAVTTECGDWSEPASQTAQNRPYWNFGCATQHNIAAQVDNAEDFERPRLMSEPDAAARNMVIDKYRKP